MRFDVQHAIADPAWTPEILLSPSAVTRFARAAEDCGYSSIGFTDHPAPSAKWVRNGGEGSSDPFSALGFCAAVTLLRHAIALLGATPTVAEVAALWTEESV
ncbi:hypothetical protein [Parafrankia sp. FMc2]|uniref:hypothetical protein n=1 Tax=Parafrankia sp. FMc2 TaxID=3233196 RepID=UPI0034D60AFE